MTTCLSLPSHGEELRDHLCLLYRQQMLCDMVLVAEGGAEFPLHKTVLHAFSLGMKTQYSATYNLPDRVEYLDVSAQSVGILLDFIYSGSMYVNNDTVWNILTAASRLQIPSAVKLCNKLINSWSEVTVPIQKLDSEALPSTSGIQDMAKTPVIKTEVGEELCEKVDESMLSGTVMEQDDDHGDTDDLQYTDDHRDLDFQPESEQQRTPGRKSKRVSEKLKMDTTPRRSGRRKKSTPISTSKRLKTSDSIISTVSVVKTEEPSFDFKNVTPGDDFHVACKQCDKMFAHYSTMHLHRRVHTGNRKLAGSEKYLNSALKHCDKSDTGRFVCRDCQKEFKYYSEFVRHHRRKHKLATRPKYTRKTKNWKRTKKLNRCNFCSAQFVHQKTADAHQQRLHLKHVRCRHCGEVFTKPKQYKMHLVGHGLSRAQIKLEGTNPSQVPLQITDYQLHPNKRLKSRFICPFCSCSYQDEDYLNKHVEMKHRIPVPWEPKMTKPCPQEDCEFEGKTRLDVMMHMNSAHGVRKEEGSKRTYNTGIHDSPNKRRRSEGGLFMNGMIVKSGKQLKCTKCSFSTSVNRYNYIYRHVYNQHQEKRYQCAQCDSAFYLRYQLKRHIRQSHGEKVTCPTCGACISPRSLKQHMLSHGKLHECKDCKKFFATGKKLNEHDKDHHKNTQFKCCGCEEKFPYKLVLTDHESKCEAALSCQPCGKIFSSQRNKKRHLELCKSGKKASVDSSVDVKEEIEDKRITCLECGFKTTDEVKLQRHMYHRHREKKFVCTFCSMSYCVKSDLTKHLKSHAAREPCPICEEMYSSRTLTRHVLSAHGKDNYHYCKDCMKCFESDEVLQDHIMKNHKHSCRGCKELFLSKYTLRDHYKTCEPALTCQECNLKFGNIHVVKRHIANVHESIGSVCDQCGAFFKTPQALRFHIERHKVNPNMKLKIPNIQCEYCSFKAISTSSVLSHYTRMHREKRHVCTTCGKEYAIPSDLTKHMKSHAPPVVCPICAKTLSHKSVGNHIRLIHGEESIHYCSDCVTYFETSEKLQAHDLNDHLTKQPYHCKGCFLVFPYKTPMKEHMRTCEMALTCTQCGVPQQSKHALDKHINRVHGEKNFICEVCGTKFLYASELNKHLQKKHDYIIVNITEGGETTTDSGITVTGLSVQGLEESGITVLGTLASDEIAQGTIGANEIAQSTIGANEITYITMTENGIVETKQE